MPGDPAQRHHHRDVPQLATSPFRQGPMKNPSPPLFGTLLRQYRLAAGWSQETLAERASISVETVSALERGTRRAPRPDTVALLIEALALDGANRADLIRAAGRARFPESAGHPEPSAVLAPAPYSSRLARQWTLTRSR